MGIRTAPIPFIFKKNVNKIPGVTFVSLERLIVVTPKNSIMKTTHCLLFTLTLLLIVSGKVLAQENQKADTVSISISGQKVMIPMPASGSRTSVRFENSFENVEISVSRMLKNSSATTGLQPRPEEAFLDSNTAKKVRWLPQFTVGYQFGMNTTLWKNRVFENVHFPFNEYVEIDINHTKEGSPRGSFFFITLKETERKLKGKGWYFYSALTMTLSKVQLSGNYAGNLLVQALDSGYIYNSTAVSSSYHIQQLSLGASIPLAYRKIFPTKGKLPWCIDLGVNLTARLNWLKVQDGFTDYKYGSTRSQARLSVGPQPFVSVSYGPVGVYAAFDAKLLSFAINQQNTDHSGYIGLFFRPFHAFNRQ